MEFARFDYTAEEGGLTVPVFVNSEYVSADRWHDERHTSIWINGCTYPILVDQSPGWVKEALEQAQK